jgi:hypothetical protein
MGYVIKLTVVICICFGMYASSNYNPEHLRAFAQAQNNPLSKAVLLYRAAAISNEAARQQLLFLAKASDSSYWLKQLTQIGDAEAAYELAMRTARESEQRRWFRFAAQKGDPKSAFELSLLVSEGPEQFELIESSAQQGYPPAVITFAKFHHQNLIMSSSDVQANRDNAIEALYWLDKAAHFDRQSAFKLAKLHWQLQDKSAALTAFEVSYEMGNPLAIDYINVLKNVPRTEASLMYSEAPKSEIVSAVALNNPAQCAQQLQFVASGLDSVVQATSFEALFANDARFDTLDICVNPVVWLEQDELPCTPQDETSRNGRIKCDLSPLADILQTPNFTHLVVFAESGRAYVQRGVMYLDRADDYSVFVHELAHFAGFVDEYALSSGFAEQHCEASNAPNIMIATALDGMDTEKLAQWEQLSHSAQADDIEEAQSITFSVAPSKTCRYASNDSYKPSADITFLEHHDTDYIPPLYIALWQQELDRTANNKAVAQEFLHLAKRNQQRSAIAHWQTYQVAFETALAPAAAQSTLP